MLNNEPLLPLTVAVEKATGQRRSPATCHRWRLNGIGGVRLETAKFGGRRLTSIAAVRRFLKRTTAASDGDPSPKQRTNRQREAAIRRAEREIDAA